MLLMPLSKIWKVFYNWQSKNVGKLNRTKKMWNLRSNQKNYKRVELIQNIHKSTKNLKWKEKEKKSSKNKSKWKNLKIRGSVWWISKSKKKPNKFYPVIFRSKKSMVNWKWISKSAKSICKMWWESMLMFKTVYNNIRKQIWWWLKS